MKGGGSPHSRIAKGATRHPVVGPARDESSRKTSELSLVRVDIAAGSARHWIRDVTDRWKLRVRFDVCRSTGPDLSRLLQVVELTGDPGDLGAAERYLRQHPGIEALTVIALSPSRRFVRAVTRMPESCRQVIEGGAVCARCQFVPAKEAGSEDRWTLVVPRTPGSLRALAKLRTAPEQSRPQILRMRPFVPEQTLTPRQATALETAYRLGFYAFPRRTNLMEISRILGVSRATTAELLRRAESKILASRLGER